MKNIRNKFIASLLAVAMITGFSSCSESFLDEENKGSYQTDYFETSQGIQDLATALYGNIRWHFGYEWAYGITLYGTDEFTNGADLTAEPWNTYDSRLSSLRARQRCCQQELPSRFGSVGSDVLRYFVG